MLMSQESYGDIQMEIHQRLCGKYFHKQFSSRNRIIRSFQMVIPTTRNNENGLLENSSALLTWHGIHKRNNRHWRLFTIRTILLSPTPAALPCPVTSSTLWQNPTNSSPRHALCFPDSRVYVFPLPETPSLLSSAFQSTGPVIKMRHSSISPLIPSWADLSRSDLLSHMLSVPLSWCISHPMLAQWWPLIHGFTDIKCLNVPLGKTTGSIATKCLPVAFLPTGCMKLGLFTGICQGTLYPEEEAINLPCQAYTEP